MQQTGRALGSRYVLDRVLGSGAMGQVWVAVDQRTGERVAAKLLRTEFTRDAAVIGRFVQERAILLDLAHPNVVRVRDLVVEGEDLAIVMDLVEGSDLRQRLREERTLPAAEAVRVAVCVLDALAEAHARGVLHRDVKPDNVLLDGAMPPQVLLSDFSIARLAQETTVRMTGVLGTAEYIAPEVFTAETVSAAADVYGTGVLLYELLAGRTPFAGSGTGYAVAHRHVNSLPPTLEGLPPALGQQLATLLLKDPRRRPSASAAADALRGLLPVLHGLAALPEAAAPAQWEPAGGPEGAAPLGVLGHRAVDDLDLDPGRTTVRRGDAAAGPAVVAVEGGAAQWVVPRPGSLDEQVVGGQTQLRSPVDPRPQAPDAPVVVEPAAARRGWARDPKVWAGAAALVVLAGVGVVALQGGDSAERRPEPVAAAPSVLSAALPPEQAASGLSTVRAADYDPESGELTTTVTWTAGSSGLLGPLFEAVPKPEGQPCPRPVWDVQAPADAGTDSTGSVCGHQVAVSRLAPQVSASASYVLPFDPPDDDPAQALRDHLQAASTATTEALEGLGATDVYPAQRLADLDVQVEGAVKVGDTIGLRVAPVWIGATSADDVDVLFTSSAPRPSVLLQALGGSIAVSSSTCSGAIAVTGGVPYANTARRDCTIDVRIGELSASSAPFDVTQNSAR